MISVDKKTLERLYVDEKKSPTIIGRELGCGETTIRRLLKCNNIMMRTLSEANRLVKFRSIPISQKFARFLDGSMLGDGNLYSPVGFQAVFHQDSNQSTYVSFLSNILRDNNYFASSYDYDRKPDNRTGNVYHTYAVSSVFSVELQEQYNRWYVNGIKVVPQDLIISSEVLLHWYLGDGMKDKRCNSVVLCTDSFSILDVMLLIEKLNYIGIKCHRQSNNRIRISAASYDVFIGQIGRCPVECYNHKFSS